jgi:hypothetical protein
VYVGSRRDATTPAAPHVPVDVDPVLAPTLRALDVLRAEISEAVRARSVTRIPIGVIAGLMLWFAAQGADDPPGAFGLLLFLLIGGIAGERWAAHALERRYRRRYKDDVLPHLARGLGDLTYRATSPDRLSEYGASRVLPGYDRIVADDEIAGTHRGMPIEIIEVTLKRRVNKKTRVVFDGLLVGLTLPRTLTATTVIATDRGAWENFKTRWTGDAMETVRLEHPEFERRYEVYGTSQVEARALLTPAFMERFVELAANSEGALPGAIHFELEQHVGIFLLHHRDDRSQIEVAVAEGHFRKQQPFLVKVHADVFEADENRIGHQGLDRLHRGFDQRDVVDHVEADADVFAAGRFHPGGELVCAPALVILDRERHFVFAQDRLGALHRGLAQGVEFMKLRGALELLIAAS